MGVDARARYSIPSPSTSHMAGELGSAWLGLLRDGFAVAETPLKAF